MIPQAPSSYEIHPTCQIENLGYLLEQLPLPFGKFSRSQQGRTVEVGAFDGITYSNHWGLMKAGWKSLLIEPMPDNVLRCLCEHKNRPWVIVEPVAAGAEEGNLEMYFEREGSRIGRANEPTMTIPMRTVDSILLKHSWVPDFDLFISDTEDQELEVLKGFNLGYWLPKLCIIETHGHLRPDIHAIFDRVYRTYFEDGLNTMFVRRDWCP